MALPMSKDFPAENADPRATLVGLAVGAWTLNFLAYKATGTPHPYCFVQSTLGPLLSEWHDGLRAILFAAVICLFLLRHRLATAVIGMMVLNLLMPGIVATLFSFGSSCAAPVQAQVQQPPAFATTEPVFRYVPAPPPAPKPAPRRAKPKPPPVEDDSWGPPRGWAQPGFVY